MKRFLFSILAIFTCGMLLSAPVFADCPKGCVPTSILGENGCSCDDGKGSSITGILKDVVIPIMTAGIGILATIGIVISGVQYLTAGDNEDQVKKSKRRIFEIIIGLAAYALIAALLTWLLPGYSK